MSPRRCGCASSVCTCYVEGTGNATVTGVGSQTQPYVVHVDAAVIEVEDTATLDLTISGSGTPEDPYVISGDVLGGGGGGLTTEQVMDYLGGVTTPAEGLKGTGLITVTYNDPSATLTVATTATANSTDAFLRARANHTGEVPLASMASDWMVGASPTLGQIPVWDGDSWEAAAQVDISRFPTKDAAGGGLNGSIRQFADVTDDAPSDGDILVFDTGSYGPVDPTTFLAEKDPSTGRLVESQLPLHQPPIQVLDPGELPDAGVTLPSIILRRQAAPSLIPVLLDADFVNNSGGSVNQVVLTFPEALAVDDVIGFTIVASGESGGTGGLDTFNFAYSTGAGAPTFAPDSQPNTTAHVFQGVAKITTLVPAAATLTLQARDTVNAALNRVHILAAVYRLPNTVLTSIIDQTAVGGGSSSGVMTSVTCGPTAGSTTQTDEVAIGAAGINSLTSPGDRSLAGTGSPAWAELAQIKSDNGSTARTLFAAYKVLTAIENPQLTTLMTSSDGNTGVWTSGLYTVKAA